MHTLSPYISRFRGHSTNWANGFIEAKWNNTHLAPALKYFADRLGSPKCTQVVATVNKSSHKAGLLTTHPIDYFSKLK